VNESKLEFTRQILRGKKKDKPGQHKPGN